MQDITGQKFVKIGFYIFNRFKKKFIDIKKQKCL